MKRTILGVVVALVLVSGSLSAQQQPPGKAIWPFACDLCGVWSYVDLPAPATTVHVGDTIHGWGQECVSGQNIHRIDIWYEDDANEWKLLYMPPGTFRAGYARPDVQEFLQALCPTASPTTGWQLKLMNMPPPGARRVQINVIHGPYVDVHYRTYNFEAYQAKGQ